jgi:hypothetical protein
MIKYFTIYGERCSGTNFLMHSIEKNFKIEYTTNYCWKHFFGHYNYKNNDIENETLFIGIIRDPIEWIDSFYKKKHHIPDENRINIITFLFNEFYSLYENSNEEIMEDRNLITRERYKNIFEMRQVKNNYLINEMPKFVKNYLLIRYEDLRDNYSLILDYFHIKFKLEKKNIIYKTIDNYKGSMNYLFKPKNILLNKAIINIIKKKIDKIQEKSLGYL